MPAAEQSIDRGIQWNALGGHRAGIKLPLSGRLVVTRKFWKCHIRPLRCFRKPHLKAITDFSDRFFQTLMIEFPALLRNSQQKGERNGEYFNHRSSLLNDSRGV